MSEPLNLPAGSEFPQRSKRNAWQIQRSVLFAVVLREMMSRVGGQWMGAVWTLFEPLVHTGMLVLWLGMLHTSSVAGIEYPVFLVTGLIPFFFFQKLVTRLLDGVDQNRGMFSYRQVKPMDVLVGRAVVEVLMNLIVYVVTLFILAALGYQIVPALPLEAIGVNMLLLLLGTSFGVLSAVATHGRPRLRSVVRMTFFPLYAASGVVFSVDALPQRVLQGLLWNPLLHLVELSRHSFIPVYTPTPGISLTYPAAWVLATTALALGLYRVDRHRLLVNFG